MDGEKIQLIFEKSEPGPKLTVSDENDIGVINIGGKKSVNFGVVLNLLMNPNRQNKSPGSKAVVSDINLEDLNELDNINLNDGKKSLKEAKKYVWFNI